MSHLRFARYAQPVDVVGKRPAEDLRRTRTLSSINEGTPNIRSVKLTSGIENSQIKIGFPYNSPTGEGEALGTLTNFSQLSAQANRSLNDAFSPTPAKIRDRDFLDFKGYPFTVVEAPPLATGAAGVSTSTTRRPGR